MSEKEAIKKSVREGYAQIALQGSSCCGPGVSCCGGSDLATEIGRKIGYGDEELAAVPEGANLGLGCGNPLSLAALQGGETVVDLGSGAGFDCFLASRLVGAAGRVIGVDMTPAMLDKARENARKGGFGNVEFRLGEIEHLPVADNTADLIISNCVINLSPDKEQVFHDAYRVLKPGGRLMISDIVLLKELPDAIRSSIEAYIGCIAGAALKDHYLGALAAAGFQDIRIMEETTFPLDLIISDPTLKAVAENLQLDHEEAEKLARTVVSMKVAARKT